MSINLTPEQEAQRDNLRDNVLPQEVVSAETAIVAVESGIDKVEEKDGIFLLYQENSIEIRNSYEEERRSIDGFYRNDDITQNDLDNFLDHEGRLHNNDDFYIEPHPVRIDAFDWPSAILQDVDYENKYITHEILIRGLLSTGFQGTSFVSLYDTIDSGSVKVNIEVGSGVQVDRLLIIDNGTDSCMFKVTGITNHAEIPSDPGDPEEEPPIPPTEGTKAYDELDIDFVDEFGFDFKPSGTIVGGTKGLSDPLSPKYVFTGLIWSNTERIAQVATNANHAFQRYLDYLRLLWITRKNFISTQILEIVDNLDDDIDLDYKTDVEEKLTEINTIITNDDFSDAGLLIVNTWVTERDLQITDRIPIINNRLPIFYDKFYNFVNLRINKTFGSYYELSKLGKAIDMFEDKKDGANQGIDGIS